MPAISVADLNNAKVDVEHIKDIATSLDIVATDRMGHTKDTIAGAVYKIAGITNRGVWTAATAYGTKDIVEVSGIWYVCVVAHTSSAAFATDTASKWRIYQGVTTGDLSANSGSGLIGWIRAATGAVAYKLSDFLGWQPPNVFEFMTLSQIIDVKTNAALIDVTAAIQAAIDHAYTSVINQTVFDQYGWQARGGMTIELSYGKYLFSTLTLRPNVSLKGAGKSSTCLYSTANSPFITVAAPTKSGEYNAAGITISDLMILGNKTGSSQLAFDLLRPVGLKMTGVVINSVGSNGMVLREVSNGIFTDIEIANCGNNGLMVTHGDTSLPSNANTFTNLRVLYNDGDGIYLVGGVNGNTFSGGSVERNGHATAGVGHYNINDSSTCYQPNHFVNVWTEGPVVAHMYVNHPSAGDITRISGWKHFGDGAALLPERALIINSGTVYCDNPTGTAQFYKTVAGSNAPFRLNKASSVLYLNAPTGSLASGIGYVEDTAGVKTGLYNNLRQTNFGTTVGPQVFYNDFGAVDGVAYRNDIDAQAWYQSRAFYRDVMLGDGVTAPDAGFKRVATNQVGPSPGCFFNPGGTWNAAHLIMGIYHLWVDSSGRLRIKSSAPASDTDGTVVGTQT